MFQPTNQIIIYNRAENKTCLKPPTSFIPRSDPQTEMDILYVTPHKHLISMHTRCVRVDMFNLSKHQRKNKKVSNI
jgi:hypothetical protein